MLYLYHVTKQETKNILSLFLLQPMYTTENIQCILQNIFPYANTTKPPLWWQDIYSVISYDKKENWINWYIENSTYTRFSISFDDNMQFPILKSFVSCNTTKIRKTKLKSLEHFQDIMQKHFTENTNNLLTLQK